MSIVPAPSQSRTNAPHSLAKISRPRTPHAIPRPRLFQHLDELSESAAVWISGPPGAGKSTLVATYLRERGIKPLWYQIDNGDSDPATFFYYLGLAAARAAPRQRKPLPHFNPECLPDMAGFARRFFRELYALVPHPSVLVFDNFDPSFDAPAYRSLLAIAIEEIPQGINVIVVSRTDPPADLARLIAARALALFDYQALRLTLEETKSLAASEGELDEHLAGAIHAATAGWAAGTTLMLAHRKRIGAKAQAANAVSQQALFDYFASEILAAAQPETRELLIRTAFLSSVTSRMAVELSGNPNAPRLLNYLYRHHLLTDRREDSEIVYQYHALFRQFLMGKAEETLSSDEIARIKRQAALLLEKSGQDEDAVALYTNAGDWPATVRVILRQARSLVAQGRGQTLRTWIAPLPLSHLLVVPQLLYWLGISLIPVDPAEARRHLQRALQEYEMADDTAGQLLAASEAIRTYFFEWKEFITLDRWISILESLLLRAPDSLPAKIRVTALTSLLGALVYRQPQHPLFLADCARQLMKLLDAGSSTSQKVIAGIFLLYYYSWMGNLDQVQQVVRRCAPLLSDPSLSEDSRAWWHNNYANYCFDLAANEDALESVHQGLRIVERNGLVGLGPTLHCIETAVSLGAGDLAQAERHLGKVDPALEGRRSMDLSHYYFLNAWLALLHGNLDKARRTAAAAMEAAGQVGAARFGVLALFMQGQVLIERGEYDEAGQTLQEFSAQARGVGSRLLEYLSLLGESYLALRKDERERCAVLLRRALSLGREQGYVNHYGWFPKMMTRLYAAALTHGIEFEYVQQVIRKRGLKPDSADIENWPWPIRIHALGLFSVLLDGVPLRGQGKSQRKPLELLKALIALGGTKVGEAHLVEALWPDSEGDNGQNALYITLHRLRKLLGRDDAVLVSDGKLTLNEQVVWVDVTAFELMLSKMEDALKSSATDSPSASGELAEKAFLLYRGHFLDREGDQAWMLGMRDKLRSKFRRCLVALGRRWEEDGNWDKAAALYRRGLELDNLAEELYRRLMVVYQQRDQSADALEVYRRCRQMLSVVLGIKPSAETEALYQSVKGG